MSYTNRKSLAIAVGAALGATLAASPMAQADAGANPFGLTELAGGYMLGALGTNPTPPPTEQKDDEAKCGEGRCGEGKCGEGRCGEGHDHADDADAEADADDEAKDHEGRCGEGRCGATA